MRAGCQKGIFFVPITPRTVFKIGIFVLLQINYTFIRAMLIARILISDYLWKKDQLLNFSFFLGGGGQNISDRVSLLYFWQRFLSQFCGSDKDASGDILLIFCTLIKMRVYSYACIFKQSHFM